MFQIYMFTYGTCDYDDYNITADKVADLAQYLVDEFFKGGGHVEDTGAGHTNDHKFTIDLGEDLVEIERGTDKLKKVFKNKKAPFKYSKIPKTTLEQIYVAITDGQHEMVIWEWDVL